MFAPYGVIPALVICFFYTVVSTLSGHRWSNDLCAPRSITCSDDIILVR